MMMMAANSLCQHEIGLEGVELTFEVLRSTPYRYDDTTLEAGIGLLWNLSYDQKNLAHICDQGGLQWILDTIRRNMDHPKVLERACGALWNFATTSDSHWMQLFAARCWMANLQEDSLYIKFLIMVLYYCYIYVILQC